jgi:excisionase family DNA binding protein
MADIVPQWLTTDRAAEYLCLRTDTFRKKVRAGVIPSPSYGIGERTPRWNRTALDAMMQPSSESDINETVKNIVAAIKAKGGRARRKADARGR